MTTGDESQWTLGTLHEHLTREIADLRDMLQERYATQTKAVDAAFVSQQSAMQTAFTAADRAVTIALLSAEKAVSKAEAASDKRFDAVNEFRGQLADQVATFPTRNEVDSRLTAIAEKLDTETKRNAARISDLALANTMEHQNFWVRTEADRLLAGISARQEADAKRNSDHINELELRVNSRLDLSQGSDMGVGAAKVERRQVINLAFAGASLVLVVTGTILAIYLATKGG